MKEVKQNTDKKYAFLMVNYKTPDFIKELHKNIKNDELYFDETEPNSFGLEKETHITLVPCLDNKIKYDELRPYLSDLSTYEVLLTNISKFENEKFDVLKCDVFSKVLNITNEKIIKDYKSHSEYKEYHPHVTIAYMKKGMADKYVKEYITPLVILKPTSFHYSWYDEDGNRREKYFKK